MITPVIGFRLSHTQCMHTLHSLGSIPARRHFTSATCSSNHINFRILPGTHFNTWVESGKCRLTFCQRTLVPPRGSRHDFRISSQVLKPLDYDTSTTVCLSYIRSKSFSHQEKLCHLSDLAYRHGKLQSRRSRHEEFGSYSAGTRANSRLWCCSHPCGQMLWSPQDSTIELKSG